MVVSLILLVVLIALAPAYGIIGSNAATGLVCAVLAAAVAGTLRAASVRKLSLLLRPALLIILLAPLVWMLLQAAPIPLGSLSDPVWASTAAALKLPIAGSISVDTGATLLSIVSYCAVLATGFVAAALTSERQAAGRMLYFLMAVAGLVAGAEIGRDLGYFGLWRSAGGALGAAPIAAIGIILSCSVLIRLRQQLLHKRARVSFAIGATIAFAGTAAALILCTLSVLISGHITVLFAAFFGAGVPISVFAIRRWSLGTWGKLGVLATASMVVVGFLAVTPINPDADPALALSQHGSPGTELMLSDVPLLGRGAGSMGDVLPVYREINDPSSHRSVTAAAVITVEMGREFLWMFIFALAIGSAMLIRASLSRGRDYVYSASGAGILLAISLVTFVYSNVLSLPASLVASVALGLAWAQARSDHNDLSSAPEPFGPAIPMTVLRDEPSYRPAIRLACALFGLVLAAEACWILIPEFYSGGLRVREAGAAASSAESDNLDKAASLALVRGDLWAKSALASAAALERNPGASSADGQVRKRLINALINSPYQADVWLTLARLADQFKWTRYDIPALLKMVYYTGANDVRLVPARTKLALRLNATGADMELQDLVKRDVNLILRRWPELRPALVEAYRSANPEGRALADRVIARSDPAFLRAVRSQ